MQQKNRKSVKICMNSLLVTQRVCYLFWQVLTNNRLHNVHSHNDPRHIAISTLQLLSITRALN